MRSEDTAMSSAEAHDVTAIKSTMRRAIAPPCPRSVLAAYAAASPEEISPDVGTLGYVGKRGLSVNAAAERPKVVANPKGMATKAIVLVFLLSVQTL